MDERYVLCGSHLNLNMAAMQNNIAGTFKIKYLNSSTSQSIGTLELWFESYNRRRTSYGSHFEFKYGCQIIEYTTKTSILEYCNSLMSKMHFGSPKSIFFVGQKSKI